MRLLLALALVASVQTRTCAAQAPGLAAEVRCVQGAPVTPGSSSWLVGIERDENVLHESLHVEQYTADCDGTARRWAAEPAFRLELEVKAWCYGMQVYQDTAYVSRRRGAELRILSTLWGNAVGFEDIYAALDEWCPRRGRS